jgi:hypothetical protein
MNCTEQTKISRNAGGRKRAVPRADYRRRTTSHDVPRGTLLVRRRGFHGYDDPLRLSQRSRLTTAQADATAIHRSAGRSPCDIDISLDLVAIEMTRHIRATLRTAFHVEHIFDCTAVPRGTWTHQKVIWCELLPHLHKILRFAHSCALHSKLNGIILRPSLDSPKTKWDA